MVGRFRTFFKSSKYCILLAGVVQVEHFLRKGPWIIMRPNRTDRACLRLPSPQIQCLLPDSQYSVVQHVSCRYCLNLNCLTFFFFNQKVRNASSLLLIKFLMAAEDPVCKSDCLKPHFFWRKQSATLYPCYQLMEKAVFIVQKCPWHL